MKKNIAMRVAAFLFILTMISTCAFATTFAKYVSSDLATDTARVAKWGVEVKATVPTTGIFQDSYANVKTETSAEANAINKVVAPGTEVDGAVVVTITGKPEVAVNVTYEVTFELGENWKDENGNEYCPLVITVNGTPYKLGDTGCDTIANLEKTVKAAITALNGNLDTNYDFTAAGNSKNVTVSWSWPFSTNDANDLKDTALGDAAAKGNAPTIQLGITCTVTQID